MKALHTALGIVLSACLIGCAAASSTNNIDEGGEIVGSDPAFPIPGVNLYPDEECPPEIDWGERPEIQWESHDDLELLLEAFPERRFVIFFTSLFCGPCYKLKREVLSQPSIASIIMEFYIPIKIELETQSLTVEEIEDLYGIKGFPTILVLENDEFLSEVAKISGYTETDLTEYEEFFCHYK